MLPRRLLLGFLLIFLIIPACTDTENRNQPAVFKQAQEIQEIKPQKPVKIKLKRNVKGAYSWDISGDNAEGILKADKRLRESLKND